MSAEHALLHLDGGVQRPPIWVAALLARLALNNVLPEPLKFAPLLARVPRQALLAL